MSELVPSLITIPADRQRKTILDLDEMAESIKRIGLINPITVTRGGELIAGERRLKGWVQAWGDLPIPVRYFEDLSPHEKRRIELEENVKRRSLTWQEQARAIYQLHQMYLAEDESWSADGTAKYLGITIGEVYRTIRVIENKDPVLMSCPTLTQAARIVERKLVRAIDKQTTQVRNIVSDGASPQQIGAAVLARVRALAGGGPQVIPNEEDEEVLGLGAIHLPAPSAIPKPRFYTLPSDRPFDIINTDFLEWAPQYDGEPFTVVHCDFPYGVGFDKFDQSSDRGDSRQGTSSSGVHQKTYADTEENFLSLVECLFKHQDTLIAPKAHMIFWYANNKFYKVQQLLLSRGWTVCAVPLIWWRSDNRGIQPDPERQPRRVYETAFLLSRGDRKLNIAVANLAAAPTVKAQHPSHKPVSVLAHFFRMIVDEYSTVLDPTCGSGSALVAARQLNARFVLGVEQDAEYADIAGVNLIKREALRAAAGAVDGEDSDDRGGPG